MAVVNNQTQLAVYLTTPTANVESAFLSHAPAGMLVFRSTPNSLQQIEAIHQQLESEWNSLTVRGIDVIEFGPNPYLGQEDIGVENLTDAAVQSLDAQFGAGVLHIYNVTPDDVNTRQLDSRNSDVAPYNGGDAIMDSAHTGGCSSGFGIEINGNPRLVTAGHCYSVGTNIVNLKFTSSGGVTGSGNEMGSVTESGFGSSLDSEVFTGCNDSGTCGGDGIIWTGAIGNDQRSYVSGIATWAAGDQMCVSGAYGGELCDFNVKEIGHCTTISGVHLCDITTVSVTGGVYPHEGDSGGPWYRFEGSNLDIAGSHTGHDTSTGVAWFTGVNKILSTWNACLITVGFGCVT